MPPTDRAKNGGENSLGKSKSGDGQFFLIEEIDSKNNPINRVMAPYAETCRAIFAWQCSEDVKFGYNFDSIAKKIHETC